MTRRSGPWRPRPKGSPGRLPGERPVGEAGKAVGARGGARMRRGNRRGQVVGPRPRRRKGSMTKRRNSWRLPRVTNPCRRQLRWLSRLKSGPHSIVWNRKPRPFWRLEARRRRVPPSPGLDGLLPRLAERKERTRNTEEAGALALSAAERQRDVAQLAGTRSVKNAGRNMMMNIVRLRLLRSVWLVVRVRRSGRVTTVGYSSATTTATTIALLLGQTAVQPGGMLT